MSRRRRNLCVQEEFARGRCAGSPAAMLDIDRENQNVPGAAAVGNLLSNGIGGHDMQGNLKELVMSCTQPEDDGCNREPPPP